MSKGKATLASGLGTNVETDCKALVSVTSNDLPVSPCHPGRLRKHHFSNPPLRRLYFSCLSSTFLLPEQQAAFPSDKSGHPKYGAWSTQERWPHAALISKCRFTLGCYFGGLVSFHTQWFSVREEESWQGKGARREGVPGSLCPYDPGPQDDHIKVTQQREIWHCNPLCWPEGSMLNS